MSTSNKIGLGIAAVFALLLVIGVLTNATDIQPTRRPTPTPAVRDSLPAAVRDRIAGTTDCEELQIIFDASWESHESFSDEEPPNLTMMKVHTAIMDAADDRMREVGCYD